MDNKKSAVNCCVEETVSCSICGVETNMTGTKLCDRCWELKTRIDLPERALKNFVEDYCEREGQEDLPKPAYEQSNKLVEAGMLLLNT